MSVDDENQDETKVKVLVTSKNNFVVKDTFYQSKNIIPSSSKKNRLELFYVALKKEKSALHR